MMHKQGTPTHKACTGFPEFKCLVIPGLCVPWLLLAFSDSFIPILPRNTQVCSLPGLHYCLLFLPFVCTLSSALKALLPVGSNVRFHLSFKLSSDMPSGKLPLIWQNDLCYSHRISHGMTTNQYISHLSPPLGHRTRSSWTIKLCTKIALCTPSPLIIRCVLRNKLFNLFKPRGGVLLKCIDNESTHSWCC